MADARGRQGARSPVNAVHRPPRSPGRLSKASSFAEVRWSTSRMCCLSSLLRMCVFFTCHSSMGARKLYNVACLLQPAFWVTAMSGMVVCDTSLEPFACSGLRRMSRHRQCIVLALDWLQWQSFWLKRGTCMRQTPHSSQPRSPLRVACVLAALTGTTLPAVHQGLLCLVTASVCAAS